MASILAMRLASVVMVVGAVHDGHHELLQKGFYTSLWVVLPLYAMSVVNIVE